MPKIKETLARRVRRVTLYLFFIILTVRLRRISSFSQVFISAMKVTTLNLFKGGTCPDGSQINLEA
jgi:hypothetical protein